MLDNFVFSLNIVMPLVILAALGFAARRAGFIDKGFVAQGNKLVFYFAIPAALFFSIYNADLGEIFDPAFMAFVAAWTILSFAIIWILTYFVLRKRSPGIISAFVNGAHRGNMAMLALPLLFVILGDDAGKTAAAIMVIIPIYNIQTLILLTVHSKERKKLRIGSLVMDIIKNPPIIGTAAGILLSAADITLPAIAVQTVSALAALTPPLALICLGGAITAFTGAGAKLGAALASGLIKVVALPIVTIAVAYALGFRGNELTILMVIHGVPTAIGAYVMLAEMGGDTYVAGTNVMLTTVASAFTLSVLIFAFRTFGIIT